MLLFWIEGFSTYLQNKSIPTALRNYQKKSLKSTEKLSFIKLKINYSNMTNAAICDDL